MTPDLEALVVAAYVFADEYPVPARPGPRSKIADAELVALAVCQAAVGLSFDRQFLGLVGYRLPGWFPYIPSQSQYNRRLRALTGLLTLVQQRLARLLDAGGARLADGTLISVANYAGCAAHSEFVGVAAYGFFPCKSEWVWGVRLVLRTDRRGLPLSYTLGMQCVEVLLLTPARERTAANHTRERALAASRLTIESVFSNLKQQMRLERHLAKTPRGLAQRIAQRLLALTLGILLNTTAADPPEPSPPTTAANSHQASRSTHALARAAEGRRAGSVAS